MLFEWAMKHQPGRKWLNWRLFQKRDLESAAVLHATSLLEADEFRNACLHPPIAIIPNGVEMPDKLDARMESSSVRTLLFAGAIRKSNGLLHLVTAWAQLRPKDWRVLIAGEDEAGHLAELRQAIAARGLEKEFAFSGGVAPANRWTLYREADLFISPGHPEDFGVEIAEALGCEVPVITTTAAPWRDLLDHRCGWWVPVGPKALTVALADAFKTSQAERSEMGQRGRKLIAGKYAWPLVAAQMKAVYDWLAGSGPKPASVV
jgi:glycosyltransferase involved in cell wall biosynthesis